MKNTKTERCIGPLYDPEGGFGYHGNNACESCDYRGDDLPHEFVRYGDFFWIAAAKWILRRFK
jgi:hypothetical protein